MTFLRRPAPAAHRRHDPLGVVPRPTRADGAVRSVAEYFAHDVDHAQPHAGAELRGIAAHLDFSLVTLTLQDDVGGLEVRRPDGRWLAVPCAGNPPPGDAIHVHAVLAPQEPPATLAFGPAEWRRKGENVWYRACCAVR